MKILITGATGYIGNKLALAATNRYEKVHALVRDPASDFAPRHDRIQLFTGDITDERSIASAIKGCEHVIHAAGLTRLYAKDPSLFYRINVNGTRNVLACAADEGVEKFVFTSSCAVLGPSDRRPLRESDPRIGALENDYEISKYWCEKLVHESHCAGLKAVIVSPSRVYGPGIPSSGNPITNFIGRTIRSGLALVPSKKEVTGNYAYIDDVVEGHFLALAKAVSGEKYILGGENISYDRFFSTLSQCADTPVLMLSLPRWLLIAWTMLAQAKAFVLRRETHLSPKVIKRLLENREVSSEKAIRHLDYRITPFETGMRNTILELQRQYA